MIGDGGYNANIYTSEAVSFSDNTSLMTVGNNLVHVNSNITTTDGANLTLNGGNGDDLRWAGNEAVVVDGNLTVAGNLYLTGWRATFVLGDMNVTGDVIHSSGGLTGSGNFAIGGNFTAGNITRFPQQAERWRATLHLHKQVVANA